MTTATGAGAGAGAGGNSVHVPFEAPKCHYDILSISRDADETIIKKAYRKLALKYHPDKNDTQEGTHQFRLVQQAYECLSDPMERKWYDEHREAILRGWGLGGTAAGTDSNNNGSSSSFLFDVMPYEYAGCYNGYDDDDPYGFYKVYNNVFFKIWEGERDGWKNEGNIDENDFLSSLPTKFGNSKTEWVDVSTFYASWESFSSCLNYAWEDEYDIRDAPNRRIRRAMEDANKKARKVAKKDRNEEISSLVRFVKRRDPRVVSHKKKLELEKNIKEQEMKLAEERRKIEAAAAREAWRVNAEKAMAEAEESDLNAGRIRLADLDSDDDEFFYGSNKKNKKKKKGKKKKRKNKKQKGKASEDEDEDEDEDDLDGKNNEGDDEKKKAQDEKNTVAQEKTATTTTIEEGSGHDTDGELFENDKSSINDNRTGDGGLEGQAQSLPLNDDDELNDHDDREGFIVISSSEEEEEQPEVWRCECCRKDFKSENQMANHIKSKKHKETFKKWNRK